MSISRKYRITAEMVDAYQDVVGEKNKIHNRADGIREVPNGLICALIHDTVWRTLGDGSVSVALNITHVRPIDVNKDVTFQLTPVTGTSSMTHFLLTIHSESFNSFSVIGNLTVKKYSYKNDL